MLLSAYSVTARGTASWQSTSIPRRSKYEFSPFPPAFLLIRLQNTSLVNWQKATAEFGATSVNSMKVSANNALKKIRKAASEDGAAPAPASANTKGSKRHKAADEVAGDTEETLKPKAKRSKKVKKATLGADGTY
jgi:hypothetical protein